MPMPLPVKLCLIMGLTAGLWLLSTMLSKALNGFRGR